MNDSKTGFRLALIGMGLALTAAVAASPAAAQQAGGEITETIMLRHIDRHPATALAALRLLRQIDAAAMLVCGATPGSLGEVKRAARASRCWRDSVSAAVRQIDSPLLSAALARRAAP